MRKNVFTISAISLVFTFAASIVQGQQATSPDTSEKELKECAGVTLWKYSGKSLNKGEIPKKTVKVPEGWKVVGGGYDAKYNEPVMIICR